MPPNFQTEPAALRIGLGLALLAAAGSALAVVPAQAPDLYREGEIIVKYRDGAQSQAAHDLRSRLGFVRLNGLLRGRAEHLRLPGFLTVEGALSTLSQDPAVEYAEPNYRRFARTVTPDDPLFAQQWGLRNTGQPNFVVGGPAGVVGADMNLAEAWDADGDGTADRVGDGATIVAVIDDAVDTTHPDLVSNIVAGFNFVNNTTDPNPTSSDQVHGTWVAGCVAASGNNGYGVTGTAWNVKLMPLKFNLDDATHLAAIEFARANGAKIINASFGGPEFSQATQDAIATLQDDDILYVAAGGNDDSNTDVGELNYPANLDADNIVAVAATNRQDNIASFSQYGPLTVDVAAPGLQIVTTAPSEGFTTSPGVTGTSFSAPYVAGIAALIRSHVTGVGWRDIKARLIESGGAVSGANPKQRTAGGRVDADRALDMAAGPSLVIDSVLLSGGDGNGRLDPGESLTLHLTVRNIWQAAPSATAALSATTGVTVNTGSVGLGDVAADALASADFSLSVDPAVTGHRYVTFTATLGSGSYAATRNFILEIGRLANGVTATQSFAAGSVDPYDEFHAWSFDLTSLPEGHNQLVIGTTSSASGVPSPDIDLLVKRGTSPRYSITVGINPESPGIFCTSGTTLNCRDPDTLVSGRLDGNESVVINKPALGTYHIVIVNFAQLDQPLTYTLNAKTRAVSAAFHTGRGGPLSAVTLGLLLALALTRRTLRGL